MRTGRQQRCEALQRCSQACSHAAMRHRRAWMLRSRSPVLAPEQAGNKGTRRLGRQNSVDGTSAPDQRQQRGEGGESYSHGAM